MSSTEQELYGLRDQVRELSLDNHDLKNQLRNLSSISAFTRAMQGSPKDLVYALNEIGTDLFVIYCKVQKLDLELAEEILTTNFQLTTFVRNPLLFALESQETFKSEKQTSLFGETL